MARRLAFALAALAGIPLSVAATLLAWPVFGWFEARTGIESLGHSGPAGWCYLAMLATAWSLLLAAWLATRRMR